jgi:hypothetical protein
MMGFSARSLLLAGLMTISGPAVLKAAESIVLPSTGAACKTTASGTEYSAWHCFGPAGYGFSYDDSIMHASLSFYAPSQGRPSEGESWAPAALGIGSRIEWRMANGKPFAAIIGRWRRLEEDATDSTAIEELLIVKITDKGGCAVATLGALAPGALVAAREIADSRAATFRCGIDKPALNANAANGSVGLLDGHFGPLETLEHNESLVELSHSSSGVVEIRYRQPRASLKVDAGTLLFRGQERAGQITGSAFLFKIGCAPAEYRVSGRRTDGVLVLEGIAPPRDPKSCAVMAASKAPKPSRLVFHHEPVVEAAATPTGRRVMAQCSQCMSATIKSIEGIGTEHARVTAEVTLEDVRDYCENWHPGEDRLAACLKDSSSDIGKIQEASANCADLTVRPSSGGEYKFSRMGRDYGGPAPSWTNLADGKVECGARACNSATATAHFTLLCPQAIAEWAGRR